MWPILHSTKPVQTSGSLQLGQVYQRSQPEIDSLSLMKDEESFENSEKGMESILCWDQKF